MKIYKIRYSIEKDGSYLLYNIYDDIAEISARNAQEAAAKLRQYCRAWNYNAPIIHEISAT